MSKTKCDKCSGTLIDVFYSTNEKYCMECKTYMTFRLKPGQKSVFRDNFVGGLEDNDYLTRTEKVR